MHKGIVTLAGITGLGLLAIGSTASAAALSCINNNYGTPRPGPQTITVNSSNACSSIAGNDTLADKNALVFEPGSLGPFTWTYLDKDNRSGDVMLDNENDQITGAQENWFVSTTSAGDNLSGTFTIDVSSYLGLGYDSFMIYIKPGPNGTFFLLDGIPSNGLLSGTYLIEGNPGLGISHMTLYGRYAGNSCQEGCNPVPESGSFGLLGLSLLGLGLARARRPTDATDRKA